MYKHILIATDGSKQADKALAHGLSLAKKVGAKVTVVTVTEMWSALDMVHATHSESMKPNNPIIDFERMASAAAKRILSAAAAKAKAQGVACNTVHVADQHPAEGIVATAAKKRCDAIVMGSHGRRGLGRLLLGSQAYEVASHSKVPTIVVK